MKNCCDYKGPSPCFVVDMARHSMFIGRCLQCGELNMSRELPPTKDWTVVDEQETVQIPQKESKAVELIKAERERQKTKEGWCEEHDDRHDEGDLARAAACYAVDNELLEVVKNTGWGGKETYQRPAWPWEEKWDKRGKHDKKRRLVIAGALIVAELERLERRGE